MKKVYITKPDFPSSVVEKFREKYELVFCNYDPCVRSPSFFEDIKGSHAILCTEKDLISRQLLDAAGPQLQIISTASITYDHIDIRECNKRSILVTNVADIGAETIAEYTIGLLLGAGRRILDSSHYVKSSKWKELRLKAFSRNGLVNANIGFCGMGRIAVEILKRIRSFQVRLCLYHNICRNEEAEQLGATAFSIMRRRAVLICIGSEELFHLEDLYHALTNRIIDAAAIEIIVPDPNKYGRFWDIPNIVLIPRIENAEIATITEQAKFAAQNIVSFLEEGKPLTVVS